MATKTSDLSFEIRKSSIQGRGAFATRRIRPGQRIVEYTGEHITPEEGDRRYEESGMGRHHTFLFTLDEQTVIDGRYGGNVSRYINHSCDPNCEAVIEDGRIFVYARKNIQPGTELTYDYQYERRPEHTEEDAMGRHHTFLFTLDDETVIDGKRGGNESRYINHSCDPNCEAIIEGPHIYIYAKKNIQPDTELTYDYQYERRPDHTKEDEEFYACRCGTAKCRGTILAPPKRKRGKKAATKKRAANRKARA